MTLLKKNKELLMKRYGYVPYSIGIENKGILSIDSAGRGYLDAGQGLRRQLTKWISQLQCIEVVLDEEVYYLKLVNHKLMNVTLETKQEIMRRVKEQQTMQNAKFKLTEEENITEELKHE